MKPIGGANVPFVLAAIAGATPWTCESGCKSQAAPDATGIEPDGAVGDATDGPSVFDGGDGSTTDGGAPDSATFANDFERLHALSGKRVYFQHASVGGEAMGVYQGIGSWPDPTWGMIKIVADNPGSATTVFTNAYTAAAIPVGSIGEWTHGAYNGMPATKLSLFDQHIRDGLGGAMNIAILKMGTPDIDQGNGTMAGTDGVSQATWFGTVYQPTIAALQKDYSGTTFIHVTIPIHNCEAHAGNVYYEQWNNLIRTSYPDRVFDLAYWESMGSALQRAYDSDGAPCIHSDWAITNDAHVNEPGANWLGEHLLAFLASLP